MGEIYHLYSEVEKMQQQNELYQQTIEQLRKQTNPLDYIIGSSQAIGHIKSTIAIFANSGLSLLLTGETGVGKEVFANALHQLSSRSASNFVKINCAAIPKDLLESELFGYEGGAFTGAKKGGKIGKFELADGGTLLLEKCPFRSSPNFCGFCRKKKLNVSVVSHLSKSMSALSAVQTRT